MRRLRFVPLVLATAVVLSVGCAKPEENKTEMKVEATTTSPEGTTERTTEATQVGSTLEMKTETKTDTAGVGGTVEGQTETFVGTVTKYEPGKRIEVMTGEKKTHEFDLDEKDTTATVDPGVVVGSKVRLTDQKGDNQARSITVALENV